MLGQLPGQDPSKAAAAKLQAEIKAQSTSRRFEQHCAQCNINPIEARRLAPPLVRKGQALRSIETKQRQRDALKAKKEQYERRFGNG